MRHSLFASLQWNRLGCSLHNGYNLVNADCLFCVACRLPDLDSRSYASTIKSNEVIRNECAVVFPFASNTFYSAKTEQLEAIFEAAANQFETRQLVLPFYPEQYLNRIPEKWKTTYVEKVGSFTFFECEYSSFAEYQASLSKNALEIKQKRAGEVFLSKL